MKAAVAREQAKSQSHTALPLEPFILPTDSTIAQLPSFSSESSSHAPVDGIGMAVCILLESLSGK